VYRVVVRVDLRGERRMEKLTTLSLWAPPLHARNAAARFATRGRSYESATSQRNLWCKPPQVPSFSSAKIRWSTGNHVCLSLAPLPLF
jgi:hypothetical protein